MATYNAIPDENGDILPPISGFEGVVNHNLLARQAHNVVPNLAPTDLPSPEEKKEDAMEILRAIMDQRFTSRDEGRQAWDALYGDDNRRVPLRPHYPSGALKSIAWVLVEGIVCATTGVCTFSPYEESKTPAYQQLAGYTVRLVLVIRALRLNKGLVKQCFDNASFPAKLAWSPVDRLGRGVSNKGTNSTKAQKFNEGQASIAAANGQPPVPASGNTPDTPDTSDTPENPPVAMVNVGPRFQSIGLKPSLPMNLDEWLADKNAD
ncbi:hypothetical protein F5Y18DRAFT_432053 [Xylariaceae sp. FL1019]|nr:hypothetical protein F5Y18DRAFT_432053 [Xylariaceae sp. FL1019]